MKISVDRVISRLEEIYECGRQADGTHARVAYSPEDQRGRKVFADYFGSLGIPVRRDEAGNLIAYLEGEEELPSILIGSHLDTVIDGGKYDGALGCVAGLEVAETLKRAGKKLRHPLEVVVFTDEEGIRFGNGMFGSAAFCQVPMGELSEEDMDIYGRTRGEVLKEYGVVLKDAIRAERMPETVHCMLELHVEQGKILEDHQKPLGVVSSIAGVRRYEVTLTGEANHSGSTQMRHRKDALVGAAGLISSLPGIVREHGNEFSVATVGYIQAWPNAVNVIPGMCRFQLEIRDQEESVMDRLESLIHDRLEENCRKEGLDFSMRLYDSHVPGNMNAELKETIQSVCEAGQIDYEILPSGAFHDSLLLCGRFPTGMIFIPSIGGISHSPMEKSGREDIERGCQVLLDTVLRLDKKEGQIS